MNMEGGEFLIYLPEGESVMNRHEEERRCIDEYLQQSLDQMLEGTERKTRGVEVL